MRRRADRAEARKDFICSGRSLDVLLLVMGIIKDKVVTGNQRIGANDSRTKEMNIATLNLSIISGILARQHKNTWRMKNLRRTFTENRYLLNILREDILVNYHFPGKVSPKIEPS